MTALRSKPSARAPRQLFPPIRVLVLATVVFHLTGNAGGVRGEDRSPQDATNGEVWSLQFDSFHHGTIDLQLLLEGDRIAAGLGFGTVRNSPLLLDTSRLKLADDRLQGSLILAAAPLAFTAANKPDSSARQPPEELLLDVRQKGGRLNGTLSSSAPVTMGVLDRPGLHAKPSSLPVWGKTQPHLPADDARIELMLLGVGSPGPNLVSAHGRGLVLRMQLRKRKIVEAIAIPVSDGASADPPVVHPMPENVELVSGYQLRGRIPVRYTSVNPETNKLDGKPKLDGVMLDGVAVVDGFILGDHAAGTLTWEADGKTVASSFRATVSRATAQVPLDLTERTWEPQGRLLEEDTALAERAREESLVPLRPGKPGQQPFYNTRLIHRSGREGSIPALYAPAIEFAEVANAKRYRMTIAPAANSGLAGSWMCEQEKPWLPLTGVWKESPVGKLVVSATAFDADGRELGKAAVRAAKFDYVGGSPLDTEHWKLRAKAVAMGGVQFPARETVTVQRRASFHGPYYASEHSPADSALAAARWNAWTYAAARYRGLYGWGAFTAGDGGDNTTLASVARAFGLIASLSPDEHERRESLAHAERIAWRMFLTHRDKKPIVYKGNVANVLWLGLAYLDVYAAGQDPRLKEAALNLAGVIARDQQADGGWSNEQGWPGGVFGPSEFRTNGGEPMLLFFGRVRRELGTAEYVPVEERACEWVRKQCLPAMMWQNVGYHSGEMVLVQDSTAPHALAFCIWMLDYAPEKQRDLKLVEQIARWCEERHVDWSRERHPKFPLTQPNCWGWSRASGTGVQIAARFAYVSARLGQETRNSLWTAKSDAMVQSLLATQDPILGGYAYHFHRTTGDCTGNLYDSVEASDCVRKCAAVTLDDGVPPPAPFATQTSLTDEIIASQEYSLKSPRSRDPVLGGPRDKIRVSVWIPDGVKVVRGAICNPFSQGDKVGGHWQAACRYWQFAYVQVDFDAVKREEFTLLATGLIDLAKKTGHPELEHLPLCFTGMSRGGGISMQLAELMPERTIAVAPVCLEVGPGSDATRRVPVMTVFGEKDGAQMEKLLGKLPAERKLGARFGIAVQWNRKHEFALANNLSFVFFDDVISRRLPKRPLVDKPTPLADIPLVDGWLGDTSTWDKDGKIPTIAAWQDFKGDRDAACWFPAQRSAAVWQAFVGASKDVTISEPPGLGDKQPFVLHSAQKPVTVKLAFGDGMKPARVVLWDADRQLAEKTEGPWTFEVSLKPGIHALIATAEDNGRRTTRPHTIAVRE